MGNRLSEWLFGHQFGIGGIASSGHKEKRKNGNTLPSAWTVFRQGVSEETLATLQTITERAIDDPRKYFRHHFLEVLGRVNVNASHFPESAQLLVPSYPTETAMRPVQWSLSGKVHPSENPVHLPRWYSLTLVQQLNTSNETKSIGIKFGHNPYEQLQPHQVDVTVPLNTECVKGQPRWQQEVTASIHTMLAASELDENGYPMCLHVPQNMGNARTKL